MKKMMVSVALIAMLLGCATAPRSLPEEELVWPVPPEKPRIKYIGFYQHQEHYGVSKRESLISWLAGEKRKVIALGKPLDVAVDRKGRVYVTDTGWLLVFVFDEVKRDVRFIGGSGQGRLSLPLGVAVYDEMNMVFVSDGVQKRVFGYDMDTGRLKFAIGKADEFQNPAGLAVDSKRGRLYVADSKAHCVLVYDMNGNQIMKIGERGTADGQFNFPTFLSVDREGNLYVTDTMNFRVQIFTPDGKFKAKFGEMGRAPGQFARPKGIGVDSEGDIYVVDAAFNNFQIFGPNLKVRLFVGNLGTRPGQFWMPAGLYVDERDRIYVVDQLNRRVQVFQFLGGK